VGAQKHVVTAQRLGSQGGDRGFGADLRFTAGFLSVMAAHPPRDAGPHAPLVRPPLAPNRRRRQGRFDENRIGDDLAAAGQHGGGVHRPWQSGGKDHVALGGERRERFRGFFIGVQRAAVVVGPPIAVGAVVDANGSVGMRFAVPRNHDRTDARGGTAI
jgi:hypothetical protein